MISEAGIVLISLHIDMLRKLLCQLKFFTDAFYDDNKATAYASWKWFSVLLVSCHRQHFSSHFNIIILFINKCV